MDIQSRLTFLCKCGGKLFKENLLNQNEEGKNLNKVWGKLKLILYKFKHQKLTFQLYQILTLTFKLITSMNWKAGTAVINCM